MGQDEERTRERNPGSAGSKVSIAGTKCRVAVSPALGKELKEDRAFSFQMASGAARRRLHAIASHAAAAGPETAAPGKTANAPRGSAQQGFGTGWHDRSPALQPPVFDPVCQLREACA